MTGPDLIRLAEELARCGGVHRLTNLVTAAVHVALDHARRARLVEAWEDGPHGVGMSDKVAGALACPECGRTDGCCWVDLPHGWCQFKNICWTRPPQDTSRPPAAAEPSGRATEAQDGRGGSAGAVGGLRDDRATAAYREFADQYRHALKRPEPPCRCGETPLANPSPVMPERGERVPLKMLVDQDWCREKIASDPDLACEAGAGLRTGNALAEERGVTHDSDSPVLTRAQSDFSRRVPRRYMPPVNPELTDGDGA